jgi:hypothetical protein
MSRRTTRKERWTQVNAKEFRSAFAVVLYRAGAWEATVFYQRRQLGLTGDTLESWQAESASAGRFKRPRNAMIAAEEKAMLLGRREPDQVKVAFVN